MTARRKGPRPLAEPQAHQRIRRASPSSDRPPDCRECPAGNRETAGSCRDAQSRSCVESLRLPPLRHWKRSPSASRGLAPSPATDRLVQRPSAPALFVDRCTWYPLSSPPPRTCVLGIVARASLVPIGPV